MAFNQAVAAQCPELGYQRTETPTLFVIPPTFSTASYQAGSSITGGTETPASGCQNFTGAFTLVREHEVWTVTSTTDPVYPAGSVYLEYDDTAFVRDS